MANERGSRHPVLPICVLQVNAILLVLHDTPGELKARVLCGLRAGRGLIFESGFEDVGTGGFGRGVSGEGLVW